MPAASFIRRPSSLSKIYIYVNGPERTGRFFSTCRPDTPFSFNGLLDLEKQMGMVFDRLSFPQTSHEVRRFDRQPGHHPPEEARNQQMEQLIENNENANKELENQATFVIHVRYRQNATWQGEIKWVNQNKSQYFRSSLEMIKLMDMALDEEFGQEIKIEWK